MTDLHVPFSRRLSFLGFALATGMLLQACSSCDKKTEYKPEDYGRVAVPTNGQASDAGRAKGSELRKSGFVPRGYEDADAP